MEKPINLLPGSLDEAGIILIDKPKTWSSFDVVRKFQKMLRKKFGKRVKIGHAGTLDPLASGLLVLCTGKQTKFIENYLNDTKTYTGIFHLGAVTPSYDLETEVSEKLPTEHITETEIRNYAKEFVGIVIQTPPVYSAIKVDGKRAYKSARKGQEIEIPSRVIEILEFKIHKIEMPLVFFEVSCSKGTYIRSLANDFGVKLGCGAYLQELVRTGSGDFNLGDAHDPQTFGKLLFGSPENIEN